jgi:hypothetical protein
MAAGCQYIGYDIVEQKNYDINIRHRSKILQHRSKKLYYVVVSYYNIGTDIVVLNYDVPTMS